MTSLEFSYSSYSKWNVPAGCKSSSRRAPVPRVYGLILILSLGLLAITPAAAAEYHLSAATQEQFRDGISYPGTDNLVLVIDDNVTITSKSSAGVESAAPLTIRSPSGKMLTLFVDNNSELLYGITAPAVSVESGVLDITVNGSNDREKGNAFGICAGSGDVTISGGSVSTNVGTTGHKNKGIYATRYITVTGGRVTVNQHGGMNTFGLDGGDIGVENRESGVRISGGHVMVNSTGGVNRNIGIDSKFGTVEISGTTAVVVRVDGSGIRQNYAFNPNITYVDGIRW